MAEKTHGGLAYRKIDLHIHTPASSECFKDKSVTPANIVDKTLQEKLDAIAITDHNSGAWIDDVKKAAKGRLTVFPGVEISSTGGGEGIVHIIALFDESCSTKDVENLLGDLQIPQAKYGKNDAFTKFSPSQVIDKIATHNGLAILAHANSTHGVMSDMRGNPRTDIINNPNLSAVEATDTDFTNVEKKAKKTRVCDFLDGTNPDYVKLAIYQASDNLTIAGDGHTVDAIGSRYTYFKLDEISLEGLRQCFCDPDVRIKQADQLTLKQPPVIKQMLVSQGFLADQTICFHEGLNSIVGGKGSGKSLIIEFLRFALNQSSSIESIQDDLKEKLDKRLGAFSKVTLIITLTNGKSYQLIRTYDGDSNPIECINTEDGATYEGDMPSLFPILAYSQNEIIKIAEDEDAQLTLIDSFIDSSQYFDEIIKLKKELELSDKELSKSIKAAADVATLQKDLNTVLERLKNIDVSLNNALFVEMRSLEKKKTAIEKHIAFHDELCARIDQYVLDINNSFVPPVIEDEFKTDQELLTFKKSSDESLTLVIDSLKDAKERVTQKKSLLSDAFNAWLPIYQQNRKKYEEMLVQAGGDQGKLEIERTRLNTKKTELEGELAKHRAQLEKLDQIKADRSALLIKFNKAKQDHYQLRKCKYDELTAQSKGRLRMTLTYATNRDDFKNEVIGLLKGSGIWKEVSERISATLMPFEFIDLVISGDIKSLASKTEIDEINSKKVIDNLNSKESLEEVLALSYSCFPEDTPTIEFRKEDGKYYPLSELSVGQKCSALLIIALSEGTRPVIVDQPEDSLDVSSVYEDIVSKLRQGKEIRQFILTTHNSSVGVASDSDNFVVLRSNATQGYIQCYGAIDRLEVKKEIIDHLEGGPKPYHLRNRKYNIGQRD